VAAGGSVTPFGKVLGLKLAGNAMTVVHKLSLAAAVKWDKIACRRTSSLATSISSAGANLFYGWRNRCESGELSPG
jgi:hypothetical protein